MKLNLKKSATIGDLQTWFSSYYPYLKIEFFKRTADLSNKKTSKIQLATLTLQELGLLEEGELEITDELRVFELERILFNEFGLKAEILRNSGEGLWLETSMTDNWSLAKQNEYGSEIVNLSKK